MPSASMRMQASEAVAGRMPLAKLRDQAYRWVLHETLLARSLLRSSNPWSARAYQELGQIKRRILSASEAPRVVELSEEGARRVSAMARLARLDPKARLRYEPKAGIRCALCKTMATRKFSPKDLPDHALEDHGLVLEVLFG